MEGWDEYLENTEQVVADSLTTIQNNTDVVYHTLADMGQEYSLSIAEALTSPWKEGEDAIQDYSDKFKLSMSATVEELNKIAAEYKKTMSEIEKSGNKYGGVVDGNANRYQEAEKSSGKSNSGGGSSTAGMVSNIAGNVQYGQSGANVKKLQRALNALGFNCGSVDGQFGDKTLAAVKKFQRSSKYGGAISADGIVGANTKKKFKVAGYASGTAGVKKDQFAIIDELGEELVLGARNGRLTYLEKGSGVIPSDLTSNLMEWGALDPGDMLDRNRPQIAASPSVVNNTTEFHIDSSVGELIHVENLNGNNPAEVVKIVDKAWDKHMKELNAQIRRYTR